MDRSGLNCFSSLFRREDALRQQDAGALDQSQPADYIYSGTGIPAWQLPLKRQKGSRVGCRHAHARAGIP
ncbi:hypothetical protein BgiMline_014134 [Biomphalaria glabrata]|nr:hypothetical protein BgiBS90_025493 [Biomphalaria glabrata]